MCQRSGDLAWSAEEAGARIGRLDYQDACSFGRLRLRTRWQGQEKESGRGQRGRRNRCRQEGEAERPSSGAFPAPSCNRAHRLCAQGGDP